MLERRPSLEPELFDLIEAFARLSLARGGAWGPEPISISEVESYCRLLGYNEIEQREEVLVAVQAMDKAYLEHMVKKQKEQDAHAGRKPRAIKGHK